MTNCDKKIYILNDEISFRVCSLAEDTNHLKYGDCTNFYQIEDHYIPHYYCYQSGIHLHCTKHPNIELEKKEGYSTYYTCSKCKNEIKIDNFDALVNKCLRLLNTEKLKDATLIRVDDWYVPEIKQKIDKMPSDYWASADVKTDKDGDTIIILYVGKKGSSKSQFFIKPEKLQLTSDHKDLDPATILSKIEVTLKDRKIMQDYDKKN